MNYFNNLSAEARKWAEKIAEDFGIVDDHGLLLLSMAGEAYDRVKEAQKIIEAEGMVVLDRFQQQKAHPLLACERDSRAQCMAAIKQLNLDLEPLRDGPGRPGGK